MKLANLRVVGEIEVEETTGANASDRYDNKNYRDRNRYFNTLQLGVGLRKSFSRARSLPSFTVQILGYDVPKNPTIGLNRRNAIKLLRRFGLETPSTVQVLQLAAQNGVTGIGSFIEGVLEEQKLKEQSESLARRVVALTPIHPEDPAFFEFEMNGCFNRREHTRFGGKTLYFFDHPIDFPNNVIPFMHYPFILGIKNT